MNLEAEGYATGLAQEPIHENDEEELMKNAMALAQEGGTDKKGKGKTMVRANILPSMPIFHKTSWSFSDRSANPVARRMSATTS